MSEKIPTWFSTVESRSMLLTVAKAWEGTPFFANSEACGRDGGVDCVRLMHGVYSTVGVIPRLKIPPQVMQHGQHSERSLLIEAFETWPELVKRFRRVPLEFDCLAPNAAARAAEVLLCGDSLCFLAGKVPHHGGIMLTGGEFLHALKPEGVYRMRLNVAIRGWKILGQLARVYRPLP